VSPVAVCPPAGGSTTRIYHLLRELSRSHEIRQFSQPRLRDVCARSFEREVRDSETYYEYRHTSLFAAAASEWCQRGWVRPQAVLSSACMRVTRPSLLREWLSWADLALVEFPWQFAYCRRAAPRLPMVFMSHNVEVLTRAGNANAAGVSVQHSPLLRLIRRQEEHALGRADLIVTVSNADRRYYIERYRVAEDRIFTVPSGSDTKRLVPVEARAKRVLRRQLGLPDASTVVFLSGTPKVPDLEGLKWVRRVAERQPRVSFVVVGGISARPYRERNIIATGRVLDHGPYLQAADVALSPIEHGGGTKLKVFDGLAAGLPNVVFEETIRGTELRDGEHVVVAEKTEPALDSVVRQLLSDPSRADALGSAGRRFVVEKHDWVDIGRTLDDVLTDFLRGARQR
jgi:glycosyltransferase involved in cell wall biosynthesis